MRLLSGALDWGEGRGTGTEILSIGLQLEIGASYGERGTPLKGGLGARLSGARLVALPLSSRRHRSNCLYPIVCQRNTYVWYVSSSQSLAATRKRRALLLRKKEKRGGVERNTAIPVLSVQPRTKPRGVSPEGAALSPTALGVEAAGGALRPRRPGQSPPSEPGAQCRQPGGARSSDEAGLGDGEPPRVLIRGVLAGNVRTLGF